jgi:hypothetical protein
MIDVEAVRKIARVLEALSKDLDALKEAGRGIPAVEKNAVRMRGSLRQLEIQFGDLDVVLSSPTP